MVYVMHYRWLCDVYCALCKVYVMHYVTLSFIFWWCLPAMPFFDPLTYFLWVCLTLLLVGYVMGGVVTALGSLLPVRPNPRTSGTEAPRVNSTAAINPDA